MSASVPADTTEPTSTETSGESGPGRRTWLPWLALIILLPLAFIGGRVSASTVDAASIPVLDAEFDFAGAARTWTEDGSTTDPFEDHDDAELVTIGRTACLRAGDADMTFDGMSDLLRLDPHATYAALSEAADKLCPSQRAALKDVMEE